MSDIVQPGRPHLVSAGGQPLASRGGGLSREDEVRIQAVRRLLEAAADQRALILECFARAFMAEVGAVSPSQIRLQERRSPTGFEWRFVLAEGAEPIPLPDIEDEGGSYTVGTSGGAGVPYVLDRAGEPQ